MAGVSQEILLTDFVLDVDGRNLPVGKPRLQATPCSCGGTLEYGVYPFHSSVNGEIVNLPAVNQFQCSKRCGVVLLQPEVAEELSRRIYAARKRQPLLVTTKTITVNRR